MILIVDYSRVNSPICERYFVEVTPDKQIGLVVEDLVSLKELKPDSYCMKIGDYLLKLNDTKTFSNIGIKNFSLCEVTCYA